MIIYKFTLKGTNRCYIGQTIQSANQRRLEHLADCRYTPNTYHFHNAIRKYGADAFEFEVIATANSINELNILEENYIKKYNSIENGFNIRNGGDNKTHHIRSIEKMKDSQIKAHQRRRENGTEGGWKRKDGGAMKGKKQPATFLENTKKAWLEKYGVTNPSLVPYTCEHCKKSGRGLAGYKRWHGNNCKDRKWI